MLRFKVIFTLLSMSSYLPFMNYFPMRKWNLAEDQQFSKKVILLGYIK